MPDRTDVTQATGSLGVLIVLFLAIALILGVDLAGDYGAGSGLAHLLTEALAALVALGGAIWLVRRYFLLRGRARRLESDLTHSRAEAAHWREQSRELLQGLGKAVDEQFARWQLTAAEKEVGLLLLKGLSHKEVAELRETSERTVRQQALALYRKAGIGGRAELSAFFFEDLLLPLDER